jgi:predicted small metal-binding protein
VNSTVPAWRRSVEARRPDLPPPTDNTGDPMTLHMTCRRCDVEIDAETEDELVERVQEHVAGAHSGHQGRMHAVTRDKILARLRHNGRHEHEPDDNG